MTTLNDIKRQIGAVKKTKQITKAMNMVAASKLRGAQGKMENFAPYASKFAEVLGKLASGIEADIHPLLVVKEQVSTVELLHFSADKGLCGSFNSNLIAKADKWVKEQKTNNIDSSLTTVGKKGRDYFRKRDFNVIASHVDVYGDIDISFINQLTKGFIDRYLADEVDEVYMLYSRFVGMAKQEPTLIKLLPIEPPKAAEETSEGGALDYLCEPDPGELLIELLPKHISVQILNAFLQNETSEHAARMAAMDNASKNCTELMDIVGGAEALKKA
ncbi:MAG: ATP synthase F1 subunit gamma [Deltaproteobacteria bacterium]|nr:ATP synthase F1 subunit gamma [Deltaproteobacteria bacterium]